MSQLKEINKEQLLQELKERVISKEITQKEITNVLGKPKKLEIISEYKKPNLVNLTAEDWKKACQTLTKSKTYQEEINLWEAIDNE